MVLSHPRKKSTGPYKGVKFSSCAKAVEHAILDYQRQKGIDADEMISCFSDVCGNQNNGSPLLSKAVGEKYCLISDQLGMRRDINASMLKNINDRLDSPVIPITETSFHELLITGACQDYLRDFNNNLYRRIKDTDYYYRKGTECKYDLINDCMDWLMDTVTIDSSDAVLLEGFYKSHKSLILSVLKISNENEPDTEIYVRRNKILKRLLRMN